MTAVQLFQTLTAGGCRLLRDGGQLRIQDPRRLLTDDLRQAIRTHKATLLRLLSQPTPANDTAATAPSVEALKVPPTVWRCRCCQGTRRWHSIYGVVVCGTCHPPGAVALVKEWFEDDGRCL